MIAAPTGRPPVPREVLAQVADLVSEAPSTHVERTVLHAAYRVGLVFADPAERLLGVAELSERASGRDVTPERFDTIVTAALAIAGRRA